MKILERERVILKSCSSDNFKYAIEKTGTPALYNWTTRYDGWYGGWDSWFTFDIYLGLFENNTKNNNNIQYFSDYYIKSVKTAKTYSSSQVTLKNNYVKFIIESAGGGMRNGVCFYGYPSFRLCILYKE